MTRRRYRTIFHALSIARNAVRLIRSSPLSPSSRFTNISTFQEFPKRRSSPSESLSVNERFERTPDSIRGIERLERFELPYSGMQAMLRSNLVFSLDFLHVTTLDDLFEDALIQKVLDIVFRNLGITQSDDFLYSS
jgi:hypothetical protein